MLSSRDDYPRAPDRRVDPLRRHERSQLLRPLLLQPARLERRALHRHGHGPVPEPRRAGRVRVRAARRTSTTSCAPRASSATAWTRRVGPVPRRGDRSRSSSVRFILEPTEHGIAFDLDLGGRDPGVRRAAAVHPQVRARALRHHALRADRLLVGHAARRRRDVRGDARPLVGHARSLLGRASGRRARASRHPRRRGPDDRACGTTRRCSSPTTRSSTS